MDSSAIMYTSVYPTTGPYAVSGPEEALALFRREMPGIYCPVTTVDIELVEELAYRLRVYYIVDPSWTLPGAEQVKLEPFPKEP